LIFSKFPRKGPTSENSPKAESGSSLEEPLSIWLLFGLPGMIRTCDLMVRSHEALVIIGFLKFISVDDL